MLSFRVLENREDLSEFIPAARPLKMVVHLYDVLPMEYMETMQVIGLFIQNNSLKIKDRLTETWKADASADARARRMARQGRIARK